jgi:phospholipid/cholesterol/gamma-HCH transport system ATP-binding protein
MGNLHNAIEFQEVSLAFGDRVILDRVSFTVRQGEAKVVMGGSGTGKSTLLRLALGLLKPDAGRILIDGEDVTHYSEEEMMSVRRKIGMVFQEGALFDSLSVYDNVAYRLREQQPDFRHVLLNLHMKLLHLASLSSSLSRQLAKMVHRVGVLEWH